MFPCTFCSAAVLRNCDLVGLPDLCTGCARVQQVIGQYLSTLLQSLASKLEEVVADHSNMLLRHSLRAGCDMRTKLILTARARNIFPQPRTRPGRLRIGVAGFRIDAAKHMDAGATTLVFLLQS